MIRNILIALAVSVASSAALADARLTLNTGVGHFPYDSGNTNNELKRNADVNIAQTNGGTTANGHASFARRVSDDSFLPGAFSADQRVVTVVTSETTGQQCIMTTDNDTYRSDDWEVTVKRSWGWLSGNIVCRDGVADE